MMASNNTVISELGARRRMLELPASEVAARFSIDETLLCAWERGERSPSLDALQQWAAALWGLGAERRACVLSQRDIMKIARRFNAVENSKFVKSRRDG